MQTNLLHPQELFAKPIRYEVPDFQRRYVWKQDEQWEPLWGDVADLAQSLMEGASEAHFLGAVVLQPAQFGTGETERRIVVDGQQRLTTLQLLIDAAQEVLAVRGTRVQRCVSRHLWRIQRPSRTAIRTMRSRCGPRRWTGLLPTRDAQRPVRDRALGLSHRSGARLLQEEVGQWLDGFGDPADAPVKAATALEKALRTKLELVVIDLGGSDDAHLIFETLNARGTPLLQSDMVKNRSCMTRGSRDLMTTTTDRPTRNGCGRSTTTGGTRKSGGDYRDDHASTCFSTTGSRFGTGRRPSRTTSFGSSGTTRTRGQKQTRGRVKKR